MNGTRVLVFSHGHPHLHPGGGEIAAHQMFRELNRRPGYSAVFVGRHDGRISAGGAYLSRVPGPGEDFLLASSAEGFRFHQKDANLLLRELPDLLRWAQPSIVHFHHYAHLGLEFLQVVRNTLPNVSIIMTLHEYLAICNNNGQMVKTGTNELCQRASPADCSRCFHPLPPTEFFLRELFIKAKFKLVDHFISPSNFLKSRYVEWGIPAEKISVIENGQEPAAPLPPRPIVDGEPRGRLAYFGQLSPYKGVGVLVEAMHRIPKQMRAPKGPIRLSIYGTGQSHHSVEFQERLNQQLASMPDAIQFYGRYSEQDLPQLMAGVDWVVMPSIWWENSPLVIQESFKYRRPMIVSGIGGMAEKVEDGVTGLHARPGDPQGLADLIVRAATTEGLWDRMYANVSAPPSIKQTVEEVVSVYDRFINTAVCLLE